MPGLSPYRGVTDTYTVQAQEIRMSASTPITASAINAFTGPLFQSPAASTLTPRERFRRVTHFQTADHPYHMEFGWWAETFPAWHAQGLPAEVHDIPTGDAFFGLSTFTGVPVHNGLHPTFEHKVLEETDRYKVIQNHEGAIMQEFTDGSSTIPHYIKFPIETREDWLRFRDEHLRLDVQRYPEDWDTLVPRLHASDKPVVLGLGSMWGWIRDWMGFENACIATAEEPEWIAEMMDHLMVLTITSVDKALREVRVDLGAFWEDMAYNAGPMVSPAFFKEYMTPRYKEITDFCRHRGLETFWVDCDGDANLLVDGWLAGGVQGMFPLERAGHMWPKALREMYGESVVLFGGVDKRAMIAGREAIEQELAYLAPIVEQGGFIPFCDHRCPPDVTYANYLYYLKRKCEVFGIPKPIDYDALLAEAEARG
jgi:uroporphyrinogen decarboxylase